MTADSFMKKTITILTIALLFCASLQAAEVQPTRFGFNYLGCFCMYLGVERNQPENYFSAVTYCLDCPAPGPLVWVGSEIECPIPEGFESRFLIRTAP